MISDSMTLSSLTDARTAADYLCENYQAPADGHKAGVERVAQLIWRTAKHPNANTRETVDALTDYTLAYTYDGETECSYCGVMGPDLQPAQMQDADWTAMAVLHADDCEWIVTRAHSREVA